MMITTVRTTAANCRGGGGGAGTSHSVPSIHRDRYIYIKTIPIIYSMQCIYAHTAHRIMC